MYVYDELQCAFVLSVLFLFPFLFTFFSLAYTIAYSYVYHSIFVGFGWIGAGGEDEVCPIYHVGPFHLSLMALSQFLWRRPRQKATRGP